MSNWEAVKEGLKLLVLLLSRDAPSVDSPSATATETTEMSTLQTQQKRHNCSLESAIRFVVALGLNTLHRGIIQHIHDALLTLLDCYYARATPAAFTQLVAELVAACFESSLPIIRRSGALPFILHSVLTVLHQHASPLLPPLVLQLVHWQDFTPLPPIPAAAQSSEWGEYASAFTGSLSHTLAEGDRPRHLVHTLNTLTVCLSSPELATHFHPHLLALLRLSLRLLDSAEYSSPSSPHTQLEHQVRHRTVGRRRCPPRLPRAPHAWRERERQPREPRGDRHRVPRSLLHAQTAPAGPCHGRALSVRRGDSRAM